MAKKGSKDRMAERILTRIIDDLPPERLQRVVSGNALRSLIENLPPEKLQSLLGSALGQLIEHLPPEQLSMIKECISQINQAIAKRYQENG